MSQSGMEPCVPVCGLSPGILRRAGLGLDGHCPILCTFTGLSFRPGVLLPAEIEWEEQG